MRILICYLTHSMRHYSKQSSSKDRLEESKVSNSCSFKNNVKCVFRVLSPLHTSPHRTLKYSCSRRLYLVVAVVVAIVVVLLSLCLTFLIVLLPLFLLLLLLLLLVLLLLLSVAGRGHWYTCTEVALCLKCSQAFNIPTLYVYMSCIIIYL